MINGYIEELGNTILSQDQILAIGGQTKTGLKAPTHISSLEMSKIAGILEYQPDEYTFTAYAGTRLDTIDQMLAENGQFMPFDPPFIKRGGTLGGTVAANISGPGRYRYGGLRDFVLGVKFFDYQARLMGSGGKVVKNAAGFDIPKLMVGSLGSLGAIIELSFKVFPQPPKYTTVVSRFSSIQELLKNLTHLTASPIELFCLEIEPEADYYNLRVRLGGVSNLFPNRIERLKQFMGDVEILDGEEELGYWEGINEFTWLPDDALLIKVPITPSKVTTLDEFLKRNKVPRRYSVGANVAWIAWSKHLDIIDSYLTDLNLVGLTIIGEASQNRLGSWDSGNFYQRIKKALDPIGKWAEV